jgi:hypothetical protein
MADSGGKLELATELRYHCNTIGKKHFTSLYSPARNRAFTPKNLKAGFAASGLFPFNPNRVLRSMPAPPAEPAIQRAPVAKMW